MLGVVSLAALWFATPAAASETRAPGVARLAGVSPDTLARDAVQAEHANADSFVGTVARPLAAFPPPRVRAWQLGLVRPDRVEHASLSFALTSALIVATRDRGIAGGVVLSLGVAKELWDRRVSTGFDPVDLAADVAGITLALVSVRARGD